MTLAELLTVTGAALGGVALVLMGIALLQLVAYDLRTKAAAKKEGGHDGQ